MMKSNGNPRRNKLQGWELLNQKGSRSIEWNKKGRITKLMIDGKHYRGRQIPLKIRQHKNEL